MKLISKEISVGLAILLLTALVRAANINAPVGHMARVTTKYIDAKISLDYLGFEGLSVDSLGKKHFPLVTIDPPAKPWRPTQTTRQGSHLEYRSPDAAPSESPRWAIDIKTNEILLESHWTADDPPEKLVFSPHIGRCRVTMLGLMQTNGAIKLPAILYFVCWPK
jgi:hypothetical protein